MQLKLGVLLLASSAMIAPAAAQQGQPNPNQAAAKALLQAADKAIGARPIRSIQYCEYVLYRMLSYRNPPWEWTLANNSGQYPNAVKGLDQ